jgi:hypothetical protein
MNHKPTKYRALITSLIVTALVMASSSNAQATSASASAEEAACRTLVTQLSSSSIYADATSGKKVSGRFFICSGYLASVQASNGATAIAEVGYDGRTGRAVNLTGLAPKDRDAAMKTTQPSTSPSSTRSADGQSSALGEFSANINGQYKETLGWQIHYGYSGNDYPNFEATIQNKITLALGKFSGQNISLSWTNLNNRQISPSTVTRLRQENGRFSPSIVQSKALGSGEGSGIVYRTSYTEGTTLGSTQDGFNYSLQQADYPFKDRYAEPGGHEYDLAGLIGNGHRWQCINSQVCQFPNGQEAPIRG